MKRKPLQNQKGETIVEVMVSFALLMLFAALLAAALRFAQASNARTAARRTGTYALCAQLYPEGEAEPAWAADAAAQDAAFAGDFSFTVRDVARQRLDTSDEATGESYTFHRYAREATP